ncbi:MAG TPA: alpha/beta fold hydrolase [candidate division WOR-3 bacterium]|uniref:Alpha/beta fold hydrolase n=1 Tax=candidate division WOR-3 bacterium TaxID=2052148 RepID=A0A7V0XET2_UNCW3|nr:alpha/beta fold hydrolase [candidate division WOR-3 bacterium]
MVMKRIVLLTAALLVAAGCSPEDITGTWQGTLATAPAKLRVVFNISRQDGRLTATLDSPDQAVRGVPVAGVEFAQGRLKLDVAAINAGFEGVIENGRLVGTWRQAGAEFPLELARVQGDLTGRRPQDPLLPLPYRSEDITFPGPAGTIAGTLTLPEGDGPFPAALLVSGSGQQNRDQEIFGHRPFLVLADHLTRRGIAVLRCDDRGIGGSTGDPTLVSSEDFALDAQAALDRLRAHPEVDAARTGIIGHSEGALIGAMLAARDGGPAFLVMLAGPGIPGRELLPLQGELLMRAGGASEAAIAANRRLQERLFAKVRQVAEPDALAVELGLTFEEEMAAMDPAARAELAAELSPRAVAAQVRALASPWFRFFLEYDPATDIRRIKVPVLALCGSKDLQVPSARNLAAIKAALEAGQNPDHAVGELPGLNHLFQTAETGHIREYAATEETFALLALETIGGWLEERLLED